jgi:hypothetical protein
VQFKETRDRDLNSRREPLPGRPAHLRPLAQETDVRPDLIRISLRSFDRQWLIADNRVLDYPRPDLWASLQAGQVFLNQQSSHEIDSGPAVVATHLVPDTHHFNGRGGRILPLLHPDGSPNLPPRLLAYLAGSTNQDRVAAADLAAYVVAVAGHDAFTQRFAEELLTPGVRVPLTRDGALWARAVTLGREVLWASTYGDRCADPALGRPAGDVRYLGGDERQVRYLTPIGSRIPERMTYCEATRTLHVGDGSFAPVPDVVWAYDVGGMKVVNKWFGYRKAAPTSKRTSPLDDIHAERGCPEGASPGGRRPLRGARGAVTATVGSPGLVQRGQRFGQRAGAVSQPPYSPGEARGRRLAHVGQAGDFGEPLLRGLVHRPKVDGCAQIRERQRTVGAVDQLHPTKLRHVVPGQIHVQPVQGQRLGEGLPIARVGDRSFGQPCQESPLRFREIQVRQWGG